MATESIPNLVQITMPNGDKPKMSSEDVRAKLAGKTGPRYWRTLEELADQKAFQEMVEREFPRQAAEWTDPVSRRGFLKLMGASMALAGLAGCTKQAPETIVPYINQPEELIPGKPIYYASAMPFPNGARPLLVKTNEFRPTKVEGNPDHPLSLGATDVYAQASVLDLYDPDRSQAVLYLGSTRTWGEFMGAAREALGAQKSSGGAGFRILSETVTSPTLAAQIKGILQANPGAKWYQYEPVNRDSARAGARMAFGQYADAQYKLDAADIICSLDADFISGGHFPNFVRLARDFASRRKPEAGNMSRLYVVESQTSTTGGKADNRLPMTHTGVQQFAFTLANALGVGVPAGPNLNTEQQKFLNALVSDLKAAKGACVVIPGEQQSPEVHVLAHAMNAALGAVGETVVYTDTVEVSPTEQTLGLKELVGDMNAGKVELLLILGGNAYFNSPADVDFQSAITKVKLAIHYSFYRNATTDQCHWHVPATHYLESWSDCRTFDGGVTIVQPTIEPFYEGRSVHELMSVFTDNPGTTARDAVQAYWKAQRAADFDTWWKRALHDGYIPGTAFPAKNLSARVPGAMKPPSDSGAVEIVFRPDPSIYDGRYVNNGWLQETPKPISMLTWDNAALVSPKFAKDHGLADTTAVELNVGGKKVVAPIFRVAGMPDKSITVYLGYGNRDSGRVGTGTGFNSFSIRTSGAMHVAKADGFAATGDTWGLATTQHHYLMSSGMSEAGEQAMDRGVVRSASIAEFKKNPKFAVEGEHEPDDRDFTLYPNFVYKEHAWGMAIDMNACVGCNACVIACVSENNISVVGKEQVTLGRHMHWLRIDSYYETVHESDVANPHIYFQPRPCMQCEDAPCEPVCPVGATVHSTEGLNDMVYNRCVGTRYCSNNCPYKVRRFNFLLYADFDTTSLVGLRNPDVSVRSRGVMEKCTYCVQRITAGRIKAEEEERFVRDGEVLTACQQACPTEAIIFGNINDANSRVYKMKQQERNYALLAELNTRPRTTYLAAVRNPNTELEPPDLGETHGG